MRELELCPSCGETGIPQNSFLCVWCGSEVSRCFVCNVPVSYHQRFCSEDHRGRYRGGMRRFRRLNSRRVVDEE
jgi:predicted nucleic acid-binding Zn ribbon protein